MKIRCWVDPKRPPALAAMGLLALSFGLRLGWVLRYPDEVRAAGAVVHAVLPLTACVLFIAALALFGRHHLGATYLPVCMGVLFFLLKAAAFTPLHRVLCTLLYCAVAALYGWALIGPRLSRRLLIPLFGLPLLVHIVQDLIQSLPVYALSDWLQEGSVLCIIAALLAVSLGMREKPEK